MTELKYYRPLDDAQLIKDDPRNMGDIIVDKITGTAGSSMAVDTLSEATSAAGVTVDGVLLKDSAINFLEPTEVVTAANVLSASESGKTMYLAAAAGFKTTLPAPAAGLFFRFIVSTAPTSNGYTIVTAGTTQKVMYGKSVDLATAVAGLAGVAETTFTFVHNQSVIGDYVEFRSDGTKWHGNAVVNVQAAVTWTGS